MSEFEVKRIQTPFYHAIPAKSGAKSPHAITTHVNGWQDVLGFVAKDPVFFNRLVDMYPRFVLHRDVKTLSQAILKYVQAENQMVLLYPDHIIALEFIQFIIQTTRPDGKDSLSKEEVSLRVFAIKDVYLFGVFFPVEKTHMIMSFWQTTGTGISSRLAEEVLKDVETLREIGLDDVPACFDLPQPIDKLKCRIVDLIDRTPVSDSSTVDQNDVYLFQTGMSAIYHVHKYLRKLRGDIKPVQFGVPFHQTQHLFKFWGSGLHFLPLGTELEALDDHLSQNPTLAIWTEIPSNPLLVTPDFYRLRQIANKHQVPLIIDDTVGSFCNIDVMGVADMVVTSLTKSFSGYADVMGGSVVLNRESNFYNEVKTAFKDYRNNLYWKDAAVLLENSVDYLERSTLLNRNAEILATYLQYLAQDPESHVSKVYYPTVSSTRSNYDAVKRPSTADFIPGYGCLLNVEFNTLDQAISFYENLHFHQGPHLGAHRTIALAYSKLAYDDAMPAATTWGLSPKQIRISVGLEGEEEILATVKYALKYAQQVGNLTAS